MSVPLSAGTIGTPKTSNQQYRTTSSNVSVSEIYIGQFSQVIVQVTAVQSGIKNI